MILKLHHLKEIEDHVATSNCPHPPLKFLKIDDDRHPGTTPLILACQLGELDAVKRIVEFWGVDVCVSAKYFFNLNLTTKPHDAIESATPLFVAAHHGHIQIVRYLLDKGADVSAKTSNQAFLEYDGLSPLYGAVWDSPLMNPVQVPIAQLRRERSAIVRCLLEFDPNPAADSFISSGGRPIWLNKLCGADSLIELINHGLDLKLRNPPTGETLLHSVSATISSYFAGDDSLVIVKLLVKKGADLLTRDNLGFTPILRAANFAYYERTNFAILDYLLGLDGIDQMDKIDALELAGATILSKPKYAQLFPKAIDYWRRAHHLREMEKESTGSSAEKSLGPKKGGTMEWTTLSQLEHVIQHPEEYKLQSLLVRLRILSGRSWEAVYHLLDLCGKRRSIAFADRVDILLAMLNTICRFHLTSEIEIRSLAVYFVNKLISNLLAESSRILLKDFSNAALLPFNTFETSLDLILLSMNQSQPDYFNKIYLWELFNLLAMMFELPGMLSEDRNRDSTIQLLRDRLGSCHLGILLIEAFENVWLGFYSDVTRLILEAGADPNVVVDEDGNAPLHLAARFYDQVLSEAACSLLVDFGAHVDRVSKDGKTAKDIWIETRNRNGAETGWDALPDWCRTVPNLLCLASRVLRLHKIPYTDGKTPASLHPIIAMH